MHIRTSVLTSTLSACSVLAAPHLRLKRAPAGPQGIDVSGFQPNIDWNAVKANGVEFAYIKATEGTTYTSPEFSKQYTGATNVGLIRGGYHFAQPSAGSGADQANFFLANGGGWSSDGRTLPGALDLEDTDGPACHGITPAAMTAWITDFVNTYQQATNRYPVIYTTTNWWADCTGNSDAFGANSPLWIARYADDVGDLPAGWATWTIWQYADSGPNPGDQNVFNGDSAALAKLASG